MRTYFKIIIVLLLFILILVGCNKRYGSYFKNNIESVLLLYSDKLITFLKDEGYSNIESDRDIIFRKYGDYDFDGKNEIVCVVTGSSGYEVIYINIEDGELFINDIIKSSGYGINEVELIDIKNYGNKVVHCKTTNGLNLVGLQLYGIDGDKFVKLADSASATGAGKDSIQDFDEDGIIDGYVQYRWSYDYLYYNVRNFYEFKDGKFVKTGMEFEPLKYPDSPEIVVQSYMKLSYLKSRENSEMKGLEDQLNLLCVDAVNTGFLFSFDDLDAIIHYSYKVGIEDGYASVIVFDLKNQTEYVKYNLKLIDNQWKILSEEVIFTFEDLLLKCIEKLDFKEVLANAVVGSYYINWEHYKDNLLEEDLADFDYIYEVDVDRDLTDELVIYKKENDTTEIFKLIDNKYKVIQKLDGEIVPIKYTDEIYYINIEYSNKFEAVNQYYIDNGKLEYLKSYTYDIFLNDGGSEINKELVALRQYFENSKYLEENLVQLYIDVLMGNVPVNVKSRFDEQYKEMYFNKERYLALDSEYGGHYSYRPSKISLVDVNGDGVYELVMNGSPTYIIYVVDGVVYARGFQSLEGNNIDVDGTLYYYERQDGKSYYNFYKMDILEDGESVVNIIEDKLSINNRLKWHNINLY